MPSKSRLLAGILVAALCTACYDSNNYGVQSPTAPTGTPADEILAIAAAPVTVQADGVSRTTITARIDSRSTVKTMTFETSRGTLVSATDGKLSITADGTGVATAELQSDSTPGTARVTVTVGPNVPNVGNVVRVLDVPFTAVNADQLLTVESSSPAIAADGFSITTITARLTTNGNRQQQIKFSTSLGALVRSAGATGGTTDTITADAQGVATIFLRSENTVGTAIVTVETLGFSRQVLVPFTAPNPNDIITLRADPSTAPADGPNGNGSNITATISPAIPQRLRTVTFASTMGSFSGETSPTPDAGSVAQTTLKSSAPGDAVVSATVAGVTTRTTVRVVRALPDNIFLVADQASVNKVGADSTTITVTLTRDVGQVSNNTIVTYTAVDSAGTTIGRFSEVSLAIEDGTDSAPAKRLVGTAVFNPDDTAADGTVTITATVGSVRGTVTIEID
jgi:hypothetical protein